MLDVSDSRVRRDIQKFYALIGGFAKLHYKQRTTVKNKKGEEILIALPIDAYHAIQYGEETFVGTITRATNRSHEIKKYLEQIRDKGKVITSKSLAQISGLSGTTTRDWLRKFDENLKWIVQVGLIQGHTKVYKLLDEVEPEIWEISMGDLWKKTEKWFKRNKIEYIKERWNAGVTDSEREKILKMRKSTKRSSVVDWDSIPNAIEEIEPEKDFFATLGRNQALGTNIERSVTS